MIAYDQSFVPPAPVLTVDISVVDEPNQRQAVPALLDTAADISVLPDSLVDQLELAPVTETWVEGFEERAVPASVYVVAVHIAGARLHPARVITHSAEYALLGRNVLNNLFVRLEGPIRQFEIKVRR
ncbi:MAG: retroviral-like aspartic protease family protein [Anaerolineae bacterium]